MQAAKRFWAQTLTILALLFLFAFSYPAFDPSISRETESKLDFAQWIIWGAFAADFVLGLISSKNKKDYLLKHPLDVAAVALPFLRPLRLLRVISFGGLALQKIAVGKHVTITIKVFLVSIFLAFISAVQITVSERGVEGSNIKNLGDGLWWAITTITTVGYGDRFPTTSEGKFLAVGLMIVGISLMGVITASVAAWFIRISSTEESKN